MKISTLVDIISSSLSAVTLFFHLQIRTIDRGVEIPHEGAFCGMSQPSKYTLDVESKKSRSLRALGYRVPITVRVLLRAQDPWIPFDETSILLRV